MKITLLIFALLSTITLYSQTQIGADIDGKAAFDRTGWSVSLSSDGNIVAIGGTEHTGREGLVRIYKNNAGVWTQIGTDIDGEKENDKSGWSVSLSSDGNTVAIGAPENDENGDRSGHVRVYKNISDVWTQIGTDIDGEEDGNYFGWSVSISSDGSVVAIGAPGNQYPGHVSVYKNNAGAWTQIGANIDGEKVSDYSGESVSLSSDGSVVAIGARGNDGNGDFSGHVRVYKNISNNWTQIGDDIDGEAGSDSSGSSVSLSSDGSVVAIGAPKNAGKGSYSGHVRIYENISNNWTQIGDDIDGDADVTGLGKSVSLSSDGSVVAIGVYSSGGNGNTTGYVRMLNNISGVWTQIGADINGEAAGDNSGYTVSLSSSGSVVAIGAPGNSGKVSYSGHVRVYSLSTLLSIENNEISKSFRVYPNPANNLLQLQLANPLEYKQAAIYNNLGQLVLQSKSTTVDVSRLSHGVYFLEVETANGKGIKKFIKK